jgi:hypothetical protein
MKIAVVGSRDFNNYELMKTELDKIRQEITKVVSGGARGADTLAERYANENNIPLEVFEADWKNLGKRAGFTRNNTIVVNCDMVVAFWDGKSRGTKHTIDLANGYHKKLMVISF